MSVVAASIFVLACSGQSAPAGAAGSDQTASKAQSDPKAPAHAYEGFLEAVGCDYIGAWAWDSSQPGSAVTIDLYEGDRLLVGALADLFRQDLVTAHKGNGHHSFSQATPPELKDGKPHSIRAIVRGTSFQLTPLEHALGPVTCAKE
jgi:hypothetical protein